MKYLNIEQKSQEWWDYKVKKVSGTRFGQLISSRENMLIDEMVNEALDGCCEMNDYENDDMQFGIENEPIALDLYEQMTGLKLKRGGVIASDFSNIHMASPDAVSECETIVIESKCTMNGKIHIARFRKGIEPQYKPQVVNYFACSDSVKEVHFISYCPFRSERPLIIIKFTLDSIIEQNTKKSITIREKVAEGRSKLPVLEKEVDELIADFTKIDF